MKIHLAITCILAIFTSSLASSSKYNNNYHHKHQQQQQQHHHQHRQHHNPYRNVPPWKNPLFPGGFVIVPDKNNNGGGGAPGAPGAPRAPGAPGAPLIDNGDLCPNYQDTLVGDMLTSFTGTFFDYFITGGGQDILGPLAVGGDFTAPGYVVNANEATDCSADIYGSFDSYGLVVGGVTDTFDTDIHGSAFLAGGGDSLEIHVQNPPCHVYEDEGTGRYDFDQAQQAAININRRLALATPNLLFQNQGELISLADGGNNDIVRIMTFNTCNNGNCPVADADSDPSGIFFNNGNFNGPYGDVPTDDQTVVFNIPVTVGTTLRLTGNQPSQGFNACKTIYNFYPVDENGVYVDDGTFTLVRATGSQLEGFTIAPQAHIRDGTTSAFAGSVIGLDYTWDSFPAGVEIHDYPAANCPAFDGCLPIEEVECPPPSTVTLTETQTEAEATVTVTDGEIVTVPVTVTDVETVPTTTTVTTGGQTVSVTVTDPNGPATTVTDIIVVEEPCHDHKKGHKCKNKKGHKKNKYGKGNKWNNKEKSWWHKKGGDKEWGRYDDDDDDYDDDDDKKEWNGYNDYDYYDDDEDEWEGYYGDEDGW